MMRAMIDKALLGATCLCLLALGACQEVVTVADVQTADAPQPVAQAPVCFGSSFQLPSVIYDADREINIYVPEIPEWGQGYFDEPLHVLYVVDGGLDQDFYHIAALSNLTLINAERQPMIVVGVRTHNRRPEITPKATDPRYQTGEFEGWGRSHEFRRHLVEEVKPFVESRFETGRSTIIGESLAGLFIVETFLEAPTSFNDYVAISPSLWWDDRRLSKQAPALLADHTASDRRLYLTMADEGGTMRTGLDELLGALNDQDDLVSVKFVDRAEGDSHASIYHHAARDALIWLFGIPAEPYGDAPWYLIEGEHPPKADVPG